MKTRYICLLIMALLLTAVPLSAQEISDWGTEFDIIIPFDYEALLFSPGMSKNDWKVYFQYYDIDKYPLKPVWSPDGKWIACGGWNSGIWIVPSEGGEPTLFFDYCQFETESWYYLNSVSNQCFTPDSKEITFVKEFYDEDRGSIVEIREDGGISRSKPIHNIESVNIETGEHRFIAEGDDPCWSHNGRYLCYRNFDYRIYFDELPTDHHRALTIYDTLTEETWFITDEEPEYNYYTGIPMFTLDDTYIIISIRTDKSEYKFMDREYYEYQLFRIPVKGGEPEQITFYDSGDTGEKRYNPDISPDGEWILYTDSNLQETISKSKYTKGIVKLCVYNVNTGETFDVLPKSRTIDSNNGKWSPDGTRFIYMRNDYEAEDNNYRLYIKDFDPDNLVGSVLDDTAEPSSFVLLRNYPNPFNSTTTLEFTLSDGGFVTLIIYNMMGQKVCELVNDTVQAGTYSVVWDGSDQNGLPVSSGVFVSRLTSGDAVVSNRMMFLK